MKKRIVKYASLTLAINSTVWGQMPPKGDQVPEMPPVPKMPEMPNVNKEDLQNLASSTGEEATKMREAVQKRMMEQQASMLNNSMKEKMEEQKQDAPKKPNLSEMAQPASETKTEQKPTAPKKESTYEKNKNAGKEGETPEELDAIDKKTAKTDGDWIRDAELNDVLSYLARRARVQYVQNPKLVGMKVTAQIYQNDPIEQMDALSFLNDVVIYKRGRTYYALTPDDAAKLPQKWVTYQLRYLRPKDVGVIQNILATTLTSKGAITMEPKTSTLVIRDAEGAVNKALAVLAKIDQPRKQIVIETRVVRVSNANSKQHGVDWTPALANGLSISAVSSLNKIFNLPIPAAAGTSTGSTGGATGGLGGAIGGSTSQIQDNGQGLTLSPLTSTILFRALRTGNVGDTLSSPTLVTEDNEKATLSIVDRVPIITAQSNSGFGQTQNNEQVRYKVSEEDSGSGDAENSREIGITMVLTPTILPDDTIRLQIKPRIATIVGYKTSPTSGNQFPEVNEVTTELIARIPNNHTLVIGGFYSTTDTENVTKVPILGDIPGLKFFFSSKSVTKQKNSLVILVTPKCYDVETEADSMNRHLLNRAGVSDNKRSDYEDLGVPGHGYTPYDKNPKDKGFDNSAK